MKNFNFAYVTDTRLADDGINIANKLELCDKDADFRCIVHGGNALCGNNPE